ncbi:MAG: BadF/BadG/BcrA/BcrD ATPase family protein [Roseinatronobacter sp.]
MQVYIGLDGGGTGSRAQAELADGRRTPILSGGPANVASDLQGSIRVIADLLRDAMDQAQTLAPTAPLAAPQIVLGLAGVGETASEPALRAALPYPIAAILGDMEISLAGAFKARDGIVMAVGTGSVLACQRRGQITRLGGYGLTLGDQASGAWIGREALRQTLLSRDGLAPDGPLAHLVWQHFGTLHAMIRFATHASPAGFAALAPMVLDQDRAQCPVAGAILDQGCDWLRRGLARLQDGAPDMPVAALGGLGPALLDRMIAQGGACVHQVAPKGTGLDGALWLARQHSTRLEKTS